LTLGYRHPGATLSRNSRKRRKKKRRKTARAANELRERENERM